MVLNIRNSSIHTGTTGEDPMHRVRACFVIADVTQDVHEYQACICIISPSLEKPEIPPNRTETPAFSEQLHYIIHTQQQTFQHNQLSPARKQITASR